MASWVNTSNCSPGSSRSPCDKQRRFTPMLYAARSAPGPQRSSRSMTTPSCSSRSINRSVRAEREIARAGAAQDASKATASSRRTAKSETHQTQPEPTLVRGSAIRLSAVSRVLCRPSCVSAHRNGGLLSRHLQPMLGNAAFLCQRNQLLSRCLPKSQPIRFTKGRENHSRLTEIFMKPSRSKQSSR